MNGTTYAIKMRKLIWVLDNMDANLFILLLEKY